MMRSLFSGVAGLKTHQTRMDVIGNNIANVNTTAYKSQSMVFNDLLYQTSQAASGANAATGRGGTNARQIGLGAKTGGISTTITTQGSAQSTNNPWDIMIEGDAFFIVSDGSQNFFTRDGSFTIDGAGNLVMTSTGYTLMGWQVDPETGEVRSDVVSALRVMHPDNLTAPPEATTLGYMRGILDSTDTDLNSTRGVVRTLKFYDALGFEYTALFSVHATGDEDQFRVQLDDIKDSTGMSLVEKYGLSDISQIAEFGGTSNPQTTRKYDYDHTNATFNYNGGTNSTFDINIAIADVLEGFSSNALIMAAYTDGSNFSVGGDATAGSAVSVSGTVTLSRAMLESSPYNLIYVEEPESDRGWYQRAQQATGGTDTPTTGMVGTKIGDNDWADIIRDKVGLADTDNVQVTVKTDPPGIEVTFTTSLTANQSGTYDATQKVFKERLNIPGDNERILEQVYGFQNGDGKTYNIDYIAADGTAQITLTENNVGSMIVFDHDSGNFSHIGNQGDTETMIFHASASNLSGQIIDLTQFSNIEIDFSSVSHLGNGGRSTLEMTNGSKEESTIGSGRPTGDLIGIEVAQDGKIKASYDNGMTKLLGQIAVAEFANPSGLAKAGNNLYDTTLNSGGFDGVGTDITANGGTMQSGVLEMSNVDLSAEFTTMITTQRGFQANSRIITVSDSLLEELTNLKR